MSRLMLLGAGGSISSGPNLWTPAAEASLLGWWDMKTYSNYDGNSWTKTFGPVSSSWVKETVGPTKTTTGIDGTANALIFTGNSNTNLILASPGVLEYVVVMVFDFSTRTVDSPMLYRDGDSPPTRIIAFSGGGVRVDYLAGSVDDYAVDFLSPSILVARMSKASRIARHNGIQVASGTTGTTGTESAANNLILGFYDSTVKNFTYSLSAIGLFNSTGWSNGLAEKIEGYCAWVGGLGVSATQLPIGHPYKSAAPTV